MTVNSLSAATTSLASMYSAVRSGTSVAENTASKTSESASPKAEADPQAAARSIMTHYDLRNITYKEMEALGRELVAAGALPEDKLLDFIPLPSGQIRVDGTFDPQPDSKMDMIARQQDMIASQKAFGLKTEYTTMVLKLYKNFQALHDRPD